jgi:hypothetical protein
MKFGDIKSLLDFGAFRPEPDDSSAPWSRRFPHQKSLLINIGKSQTTWKTLGKGGKLLDGGIHKGEFKDAVEQCAADWRGATEDGWCAVSMNTRYVISLENNLSRKPGVEDLIRTNPRAAIGSRYERGKRYALTHNPESVASILLACEEEQIRRIEGLMKEAGLQVGRVACGTYALLVRLLEEANPEKAVKVQKPEETGRRGERMYLVCCEGSVCALLQTGELWTELRSRTDLYTDGAIDPALDLLQPLTARLDPGAELLVATDTDHSPIVDRLREQLPEVRIEDLSQPQHLWRVLAEL